MLEARTAVLEALTKTDQNPELLRFVWAEYTNVCEQAVDTMTPNDDKSHIRAQLQIAKLIHRALIFREVKDMQRYTEGLIDAEEYAFNMSLDKVSDALRAELASL